MSNKPRTKCRQPRYLHYPMCIDHMLAKWHEMNQRKAQKQRAHIYNTGGPHFGDPMVEYLREVSR